MTSKDTIGLSSSDLEPRVQSLALVRPSPLLPALALPQGPAPWQHTIDPSRCQRCRSPPSKLRLSQDRRGPSQMPSKREYSRATSTWISGSPGIPPNRWESLNIPQGQLPVIQSGVLVLTRILSFPHVFQLSEYHIFYQSMENKRINRVN
jgi:hypothetical protein